MNLFVFFLFLRGNSFRCFWKFQIKQHFGCDVAARRSSTRRFSQVQHRYRVSLLAYWVGRVLFPECKDRDASFQSKWAAFVMQRGSPVCCWRSLGNKLWMSLFDTNHPEWIEKCFFLMHEIWLQHDEKWLNCGWFSLVWLRWFSVKRVQ